MGRVIFSRLAETDLDEIADYIIAQRRPRAARELVALIQETCERLTAFPNLGAARPEFAGGDLRAFHVKSYIIFYRPGNDGIEVARVLHGARDLDAIL